MQKRDIFQMGQITARMMWRWHFYAGLFCIPFIVVLSITGPVYLFKPQIETWIDRPYDHLGFADAPQSATAIVRAAMAAVPGGKFKAIEVRPDDHDAARVIIGKGGEKIRVYVHPQTLAILKQVAEKQRFMEQVKDIHGELLTGKTGQVVVELAASWAIVMILTGLYLWWPRNSQGLAGLLYPRLNRGSRLFWRDLHAVIGLYVSALALFLLLSGLPWTSVWGGAFKQIRIATHTMSAKADWSLGRADEKKTQLAEDGTLANAHADHEMGDTAPMPGMDMSAMPERRSEATKPETTDLSGLDAMIVTVRKLDLPAPVSIVAPSMKVAYWTAQSDTPDRPLRVTMTLDPTTAQILDRQDFRHKHPIDQVVGYMIAAHEGQLFGWVNQALGVFTALSLLTLCVSGVVMWLKRRPQSGLLGAPKAMEGQRVGWGLASIILFLAVFLPTLGISLVVVALVEFLVLKRVAPLRDWLGLKS